MDMRRNPVTFRRFHGKRGLTIILALFAGGADLCVAENLQTLVNRLFQGKVGAAIVSDPHTGRILALWNPEIAFKQAYTPGSTAKLVASAAALEEYRISPSETIMCRRVPRLLGEPFHCSHPPVAQPYDLATALANSCNYFFSELSTRLSSPTLAHWYAAFGFAAGGEDGSPGEVQISDKPREKALATLGEQGVTATPAQVLSAYSAIASGGRVYHLILPGQRKAPSLEREVPLRKSTLDILTTGLRACVEEGSCHAAAVPGVSVAGKTGTAPALDGSRVTDAWFVGFAPADAPEVALVVFLKRGTGGNDAAPLAAKILKQCFALRKPTP